MTAHQQSSCVHIPCKAVEQKLSCSCYLSICRFIASSAVGHLCLIRPWSFRELIDAPLYFLIVYINGSYHIHKHCMLILTSLCRLFASSTQFLHDLYQSTHLLHLSRFSFSHPHEWKLKQKLAKLHCTGSLLLILRSTPLYGFMRSRN